MKTRIVDSKELSSKSLRAETYIIKPYRITYVEEITHTVDVHLNAASSTEARYILRNMPESELAEYLGGQKNRSKESMSVRLIGAEEIKRKI